MEMNLAPITMKRLTVTGSTLRPRTVEEKAPTLGREFVRAVDSDCACGIESDPERTYGSFRWHNLDSRVAICIWVGQGPS